ncbi:ABC transporter substrate-binding protein [Lysobacter sp. GX 14042]|uniref:MlaC/ttg2D family ABC transporter substrate-binding protein n=1 Tax=Lysobacter sp. GX 14042 TaxID=2907155 RepID=UPI001F1DED3D|nr:ABC transporter substrate-binding protein [Lysobacter sp. GX 14042]MCE7032315.1 ABC transporter substrate-binding protein [Lysobacter sp. GX 14042]
MNTLSFRPLLATAIAAALLAAAPATVLAAPAPQAAAAQAGTPAQLVQDNFSRILSTLQQRRAEFTADRGKLRAFISAEFEQMFDREYSARLVLGRHGRGASDAEVAAFADALAESLMSRYGDSLLDFNSSLTLRMKGETPLRDGAMVRVATEMERPGGEPIPVDYLLRQSGGQWKVFDVMVEGVSFVQTYRNQFDGPLTRGSIGQVTADLKAGRVQAGN